VSWPEVTTRTPCLEPECDALAWPEGDARIIGKDHDGHDVWMQRFFCVKGHHYDVELPPLWIDL